MRKQMVAAAVLVALAVGAGQAAAAPERIGSSYVLQVPAPAGFVRVTPDMKQMYPYTRSFDSPPGPGGVDLVATYMPAELGPMARRGAVPEMDRWCLLQVVRSLRDVRVTPEDFTIIFQPGLIATLEKQGNDLLSQNAPLLDGQGDRIMKALEIPGDEGALKVGLISSVALKPHDVGAQHVGFSAFLRSRLDATAIGGQKVEEIIAMTTYAGVAGERMIQQVCYGQQGDLAWTRSTTRTWVMATQTANR